MDILKYILLGIDGILCLVIIALMLLQAGKGAGSSIMGGDSSSSDSSEGYLSHNKDRSRDARLRRATLTCGIIFMIITYVLGLLYLV